MTEFLQGPHLTWAQYHRGSEMGVPFERSPTVARRTQRRLIPGAQSASWAPTGDRIAYVLNDTLRLWSRADIDWIPDPPTTSDA